MSNSNEMKKTLGLSTALATVVGSVIGSGVFFKPQLQVVHRVWA